jgi:RsiW-degrading membrane proteinase PrsW (M82 family)
MSISSMTNVAFARRSDVPPLDQAPKTTAEIVQATGGTDASRSVASQVQMIATYIPTEVLTLYVAVLAALQSQKPDSNRPDWIAFFVFLCSTPVVVWLSYAAKVRAANKPLSVAPR